MRAPSDVRFATNVIMVRSFVQHAQAAFHLLANDTTNVSLFVTLRLELEELMFEMDNFKDFLAITENIETCIKDLEVTVLLIF